MKGEIVSVGTELLLGMIVDTNAQFLTQQLAEMGVDVYWISQVGDNLGRVVDVFQRGLERSDLIITTGGVGPTEDDLTREAIAATLGETIAVDPVLERWLRDTFARRNRPMPERNLKQASLIPSAQAIDNPVGTAPGWWVEHDGKIIVAMPGVPSEMRLMWEHQVRPRILQRTGAAVLITKSLKVLGLGESAVEEALGDLIHGTNPTVATYAKPDGVQVRLSAKASDERTAQALLAPAVEAAERCLKPWVYAHDDETLAGLLAGILGQRGWTLASAERHMAGALAAEIAADDNLMQHYRGGFVIAPMGTTLGVDSADPRELATAVRLQAGSDIGVAAVLHAGPERPTAEFAIDVRGVVASEPSRWNFRAPELRRRAAVEALALLLNTLRAAD